MSKFESPIREIPYSQEKVYAKISDLSNFEGMKDKLPQDKVQDLTFDSDSLSFKMSPVGEISMKVVERTPSSCVKFESVTSPMQFALWIQVVPTTDTSCKMKVTVDASIPIFVKGMVQKPLQDGLEKMVTILSMIEY